MSAHAAGTKVVITRDDFRVTKATPVGSTGVVGPNWWKGTAVVTIVALVIQGLLPESALSLTWQEVQLDDNGEAGAWPVDWMRPLDEDTDEDDQEVIKQLTSPIKATEDA